MIEFSVYAKPIAKGRARHARRGNFITTYTPKLTAGYEKLVRECFADVYGDFKPLEGALIAEIYVFKAVPKSWPKKRRDAAIFGIERPTSRPDTDNYCKIILDALNGLAYADDSQVVKLISEKTYAETDRTFVSIRNY